jgi:hypothetical protein
MESKDLKALLEKYENAETTIDEEKILRKYFKENKSNLENKIFDFYTNEQKISTSIQIKTEPKVVRLNWKVSAIAASFVVGMIIATFWMGANKTVENNDLGTFSDPDLAYLETVKALEMVSVELNKGIEQAKYLNEFENTKNLIFKK